MAAKEPKIAAAAAISANSSGGDPSRKKRAQRIEDAMRQAVEQAAKDGLRMDADAAKVRERMMAARQKILDEG